jgi:hypothetical protein
VVPDPVAPLLWLLVPNELKELVDDCRLVASVPVVESETVLDDVEPVDWFETELLTIVVVPVELTPLLKLVLRPVCVKHSLAVELDSDSLSESLVTSNDDD